MAPDGEEEVKGSLKMTNSRSMGFDLGNSDKSRKFS